MYFTKIELHNFGIYKGTHVMALSTKNEEKNITLVGGLNGRGKTTFHDAILLALYGKNALKYIQEKERSYEKLLLNRINKHSREKCAYVSITMILDDKSEVRIKREWHKNGSKLVQSLQAKKNGVIDELLGENWDFYIDNILPFGIARFFFFNNEKITQLADDVSFEQIKSSIKSAIGITVIEKAIDRLDAIIQRKEKDQKEFELSEENLGYRKTSQEIEDIDKRLSSATVRANQLELRCDELAGIAEAQEKEFWAAGGNLSKNRETIKEEKQRLVDAAKSTQDSILKLSSDAASPLFMCRDLVTTVYDDSMKNRQEDYKRHTDELQQNSYYEIIERIRKLIISDDILAEITQIVKDVLLNHLPEAGEDKKNIFTGISILILERLLTEFFPNFSINVNSLLNEVESQENELMTIDSHLDAVNEKTAAMKLFEVLKDIENERSVAKAEYQHQLEYIQGLTKEREALVAKRAQFIKAITARENTYDDNTRIMRYALMSIDVLSELKVRLQRQKVEKLSRTATSCFRNLVEKDTLISRIDINPESLDVIIFDFDDNVIQKDQLSAGEQQMFAVSIVWALALTSGYKAPVVIDTPMARLDSQNRSNFVQKYLPAASEQVIVLSTDEEIYGHYLDLILDNVIDTYTLRYHEDGQFTDIVSGYFEEV